MTDSSRLPHESRRSYQAFCDYLAMGSRRSIRELHKQYLGNPLAPTQYISTMWYWSDHWNWSPRADAFDAANQRRQLEDAAAEMDHKRRLLREQQETIGRALVGKGGQRLQAMDPGEMAPHHMTRVIELGIDLQRLALDMPTERVAVEEHMQQDLWEKRMLEDPDFAREYMRLRAKLQSSSAQESDNDGNA